MQELEQKISKLLQEEQPITESEAQDLAHLICELPEIKGGRVEAVVMPNEVVAGGSKENISSMLLLEVMKCEMKHDENGHAYLKVPSRSLFDLGTQISDFLQSDSQREA